MKLYLSLAILLLLSQCTSESPVVANQNTDKILFIVSNAHYYGNSKINSANHFAEIVLAYDVLKNSGYSIDFVSPEGGAIPLGYIYTSDSVVKKYLYDGPFMDLLENTNKPSEVVYQDYQAVYYSGGGSAMFGVPENEDIQKIVMDIYEKKGGIVSAVCHGTAGIVNLKNSDGSFLVADKLVNGFPDLFENKEGDYFKEFPFSIQEAITQNGGIFKFSEEGWDGYTETDGRLITGQDPTSSALVAQKIVDALNKTSL